MPNALIRSPVTLWVAGGQIFNTELQSLDTNLAAGVDGDNGGCWAPAAPIILAGGGLHLTGPLVVTLGGSVKALSTGTFACNDGDYELLSVGHTGRTRQVVYPCARARPWSYTAWRVRREDAGLQAWAPSFNVSDGAGFQVPRAYVPVRAHDGSTLSSVAVTFKVGYPHTALPTVPPSARVLRVDRDGNVSPLTSQAAGGDSSGYVYATKATSPALWYANGAVQTLTIPCDQNNVVDVSSYDYMVEIVEEQGLVGYPWQLTFKAACAVGTTANIALMFGLALTIDNVAVNTAGTRVLVKNQTDPTQNGIYLASAGPWVRAPDLANASDFTQGVIVPVNGGDTQSGSYWQAATSTTSWTPGGAVTALSNWAAGFGYNTLWDIRVQPTVARANGLYYQANSYTGSPVTGGSEPAWPTTIGATVLDGTPGTQFTWTCTGKIPSALSFVTKADVVNPTEASALIAHGLIWLAATVTYTGIVDTRFQ